MTKAASFSLGFIFLLAVSARAQTADASDLAVSQAVIRQANTIELRQKLADAKAAGMRGDLPLAAKNYEDAYILVQQVGSGIDAERAQTISGLASTRLQIARQDQSLGDLVSAQTEIDRVLKVDPQNQAALAFKKQNDQMIAASKGMVPDKETTDLIPVVQDQKIKAGTLVQDGRLLFDMGKTEEAEVKFNEALKLDPANQGAIYYLRLTKQSAYGLEEQIHTIDTDNRMLQVEKGWVRPRSGDALQTPNPYAVTNLIYTGPGRQAIESKLDRIRMDAFFDGLPLGEVVQRLSDQAKLRDPDKKGINFLINNNNGATAAGGASAPPPGVPGAVDSNGLPVPTPAAGGGEGADIRQAVISLNPALTDVRLADVLDAIVQVADRDHPIKYTVEDYAIVFSPKGLDTPQLYTRTFKVDPNTFYQGLESVTTFNFGSTGNNNNSGGNNGGNNSGGNNNNNNSNSGGNNNNNSNGGSSSGATVPVVDVAPGGGGGGRNGGGRNGNGGNGGNGGGATTTGGGPFAGGGLHLVTAPDTMEGVSVAAQTFFKTLGVDLTLPGKSIFFNDRLGLLFVKASDADLDTIERAIQALNQIAPQVHIKARFIEVEQDDNKALGFDWYLGQFGNNVVASGGSSPSLGVPTSAANPSIPGIGSVFPGNTTASVIPGSASDQLITGGLRNSGPALATVTGIMTDPNFRVVIHALEQRSGFETLAEPEAVTTSGRQTQMRATDIKTIVTSYSFQNGGGGTATTGTGTTTTTTQ